jgi:hypothetical protein
MDGLEYSKGCPALQVEKRAFLGGTRFLVSLYKVLRHFFERVSVSLLSHSSHSYCFLNLIHRDTFKKVSQLRYRGYTSLLYPPFSAQ